VSSVIRLAVCVRDRETRVDEGRRLVSDHRDGEHEPDGSGAAGVSRSRKTGADGHVVQGR